MTERKRHPDSERFHELLKECAATHDKKMADYGDPRGIDPFSNINSSKEFGVSPWKGAMIRANDKMNRLKTFAMKGSLENEPVEDSLIDLANYSLIALVLYEKEQRSKNE